MKIPSFIRTLFVVVPAIAFAQPVDRAELQALRAQVQQLEQQLKVLAKQLEQREEAMAVTAAPAPAKVTVADTGYALSSADAANRIRFGALLHFDSRIFFDDGGGIVNTMHTLRRMRLITEGTLARRFSYQFVPEFGGSAVTILDANLTTSLTESLNLKVGKFKTPLGLEVLQSDAATSFTERSMVASLLPGRDLGVQFGGSLAAGRVTWTAGVFNGLPDGVTSNNFDYDDDKDVVARVMAAPFKGGSNPRLHGLTFGIAASEGRQKTTAGRATAYRSDGQQTFFSYNAAVLADGRVWRVSPQLDYRAGPLGVMAEYAVTAANLRPNATGAKRELRHTGWQVSTGYVVTGEDSSYGQVVPRVDFNPPAGTWGALELFARYASVRMDADAFPLFASPAASASGARSVAVGANWFLSKAVVFKFDYYQTAFDASPLAPAVPASPIIRQGEKVFITRFQLAF